VHYRLLLRGKSVLVSCMCENDITATMVKAFVKSGPEMETATQKSTVGWLLGALDFCLTLDSLPFFSLHL
jgi:hypothetical protein